METYSRCKTDPLKVPGDPVMPPLNITLKKNRGKINKPQSVDSGGSSCSVSDKMKSLSLVVYLNCALFIFPLFFSLVAGTVNPLDGGVNSVPAPVPAPAPFRPCIPRDFGRGSVVCVCNATYCDVPLPLEIRSRIPAPGTAGEKHGGLIQIYTSSKSGQRLHKSTARFNSPQQEDGDENGEIGLESQTSTRQASPFSIFGFDLGFGFNTGSRRTTRATSEVLGRTTRQTGLPFFGGFSRADRPSKMRLRRSDKYQKILGIGGSFTDAAGLNIASLSKAAQENLMKSYFGRHGIDYSMGRVPMGGTDFSTRPYTYDDRGNSPDANLTHFSLQPEDFDFKLPYIKWAEQLRGDSLKLIASPWSAPSFMTTRRNNKLNGAGVLRKEFYQTWADYFVRFLEEYQKEGVKIWGVTTGNEPFNGFIARFPFNCMGWKATDARDWIINNLGPTLKRKRKDLNVQIIIFDDNKGGLPTWTKEILENNRSAEFVDGIGTHWYFDFLTGAEVLTRVHNKHPDYFIIQTEACLGFTPWELDKVIPGSWERGEKYLEAIIRDMKNWVSGWVDWNLAVDLNGGPNWAKFAADAAILVDKDKDEFLKQPIFYAMGHVSKFVPPDSHRIELSGTHVPPNLQSVAFLRPDNGTVILFLNKLHYDAKVSLFDEERGSVFLKIPARSMQTLVYF